MSILMISCSQTELPETSVSNLTTSSTTRATSADEDMLQFDNEAEFQAAVDHINSLASVEDKINWVHNSFGDFKSIQDLYWDAMNEVDNSDDDSMESFKLFQEKYNGLYFPQFKEDMGFYIPMTNLDEAFLANRNCEVSIGGSIRNLRDINDYETLVQLDRAYYSAEKPMTIGTIHEFSLSSTSMDPVGPEYDSGWRYFKENTTDGTERKVKLKVRRKFVTIPVSAVSNGSESRVHLELCFRKKRWYGFTNYNGQAKMTFNAVIPGIGNVGPYVFEHESYSSHDDEFLYPINIYNDGYHWYYTFAEAPFNVTVNFNKIKDPIIFSWNMFCVRCVTRPDGPAAPIFPNF